MARRMIRRARPNPRYKWCGHSKSFTVLTQLATATSDVQLLCPSLGDSEQQGEVTVERILLQFSIRRLLTSATVALGFLVANQKVVPTTGAPLVVLDPLEVTSDNFEFGSKDLFLQGMLPMPALLIKADDSLNLSQEVLTKDYQFKGRKRLQRLTHALTLTITCDISSAIKVFTTARTLVRFN